MRLSRLQLQHRLRPKSLHGHDIEPFVAPAPGMLVVANGADQARDEVDAGEEDNGPPDHNPSIMSACCMVGTLTLICSLLCDPSPIVAGHPGISVRTVRTEMLESGFE
eukprot:295577-Hanusia_phi.AAC.1